MNVTEAVRSRISCRAFADRPVPEATIRDILDVARYAPSGGNLQPWHVDVLGKPAVEALVAQITPRLDLLPKGEGGDFAVYPDPLHEPYAGRRFRNGADLYAALGIDRSDRAARLANYARNFTFFGAPCALFVSLDRSMGPPQWADIGMFVQTIMLLAREHGLHSCAQEAWTYWHRTLHAFLDLPPERLVFCGIAIGYMDEDHPVNRLRTEREPVDGFARFHAVAPAAADGRQPSFITGSERQG